MEEQKRLSGAATKRYGGDVYVGTLDEVILLPLRMRINLMCSGGCTRKIALTILGTSIMAELRESVPTFSQMAPTTMESSITTEQNAPTASIGLKTCITEEDFQIAFLKARESNNREAILSRAISIKVQELKECLNGIPIRTATAIMESLIVIISSTAKVKMILCRFLEVAWGDLWGQLLKRLETRLGRVQIRKWRYI